MTTIGGAANLASYGLVGQLGTAAASIAQNSAVLTQQASDGLVSDSVGKLGTSTGVVLDLQPQLSQLSAYAANGVIASNRLTAASVSLAQLTSISNDLGTSLLGLRGMTGTNAADAVTALASTAQSELGEIAGLLNTKVGDTYVFAGGDGSGAPVATPETVTSGTLYAGVGTAIAGLDNAGASGTLQAILAAAASTTVGSTPFAAGGLATSQPVAVGAGTTVATSVPIATATSAATATSTGSSVRDLVAALSAAAQLTPADLASGQMDDLLSGLSAVAASASAGLTAQGAQNGASQDVVTDSASAGRTAAGLLTAQLGSLTNVDAAEVATKLSASNSQLQASYMLISDLKDLDLADYL